MRGKALAWSICGSVEEKKKKDEEGERRSDQDRRGLHLIITGHVHATSRCTLRTVGLADSPSYVNIPLYIMLANKLPRVVANIPIELS